MKPRKFKRETHAVASAHRVPYARNTSEHSSRRRVYLLALAAIGVGLCAMSAVLFVQSKLARVEYDERMGPIRWSAVVNSPKLFLALLGATWATARPESRIAGAAPLSGFLGSDCASFTTTLELPMRYDRGRLVLNISVRNDGKDDILIPSYDAVGVVVEMTEWRGQWLAYYPENGSPFLSLILVRLVHAFSGVSRTLSPGKVVSIPISIAAPEQPCSFGLVLEMYGSSDEFLVEIDPNEVARGMTWQEVSNRNVTQARFDPNLPRVAPRPSPTWADVPPP